MDNNQTLILLLIVSITLLGLAGYFLLIKPAQATHKKLKEFKQEAECAPNRDKLQKIQSSLIQYAHKHCWHPHLVNHAQAVNQFIMGRLNGINTKRNIA